MIFGALASHGFYLNRWISDRFKRTYIYLHYICIISHIHKWYWEWFLVHSQVTVSTSTGASLIDLYVLIYIYIIYTLHLTYTNDTENDVWCTRKSRFLPQQVRLWYIYVYLYIFTLYLTYTNDTGDETFGALASHGFYLNRRVSHIFMYIHTYVVAAISRLL